MKLAQIIDPLLELLKDSKAAEEALDAAPTQFTKRAYIRSVFAYIEGSVWLFKQAATFADKNSKSPELSAGEHALLSDESYELNGAGKAESRPKFLRLPDNLLFTIRVCNQLFKSDIEVEKGSKEWQRFCTQQQVRNRITHPKSLLDYTVSDAEIEECKQMVGWYNTVSHKMAKSVARPPAAPSPEVLAEAALTPPTPPSAA